MKKLIIGVSMAAMLSGCQTTDFDGKTIGTVIGAGAGALAGAFFGEGSGRLVAVGVGTFLGGFLGGQIGENMDEADQEKLGMETGKALANAKDGEAVDWQNPDTGTKGTIKAVSTTEVSRETTIIRTKAVQLTSNLELIGEEYKALKNSNVRAAPTTNSAKVDYLEADTPITAVGRVSNSEWILVARGKTTIGYVYEPLISPMSDFEIAERTSNQLRTEEQSSALFGDLSGSDAEIVQETVTVKTKCRTMNYDVTTSSGENGGNEFTACKQSDGAWEIS
jgi:surface antigen